MIKIDAMYFVFSGVLFTYFGLKGEFILAYNGIALFMAWASFFLAFSAFKKKDQVKINF
ncbi:hypothetical protein [Maribacter stanieri]|uniref:hypothetical protein n=1 Tax=Maribacter stanieri TaxID=440514 RepID=UPI0030D79BA8|tara:strand:+ start:6162 stop:6338 length:177 start_codon:yes stop_codon:yes gene_type:complete